MTCIKAHKWTVGECLHCKIQNFEDEVRELQEQYETLNGVHKIQAQNICDKNKRLQTIQNEMNAGFREKNRKVKELRETLEFYGEHDIYIHWPIENESAIYRDQGERARETLGEK